MDLSVAAGHGVVWSASPGGFHANAVVLEPGGEIGAHRNDTLDVLLVVLEGTARLEVDDSVLDLRAMTATRIPAGRERRIVAGPTGVRYLTVHGQRGPLQITVDRPT